MAVSYTHLGRIIYTTGIQGGQTFRSGWDGVGASLYPSNSKWNLELDKDVYKRQV